MNWQPIGSDSYTGNADRGTVGPSLAMMQVMRDVKSLACIFLFMLLLAFVSKWRLGLSSSVTKIGLPKSLLQIKMANRKGRGIL